MKTKKLLYILPLAVLVACEPEFDDVEFNGGSADFTRTVAVGNSLTAGFQSGALRRDKQEVSFPAMIAQQLQKVGGGDFKQPLLADGVGVGSTGNAEFGIFIKADCQGTVGPSPGPIASAGQLDQFASSVGAAGPYNNVGVPGAKSFHVVAPGYGNPVNIQAGLGNPYYGRFANPLDFDETMLGAAVRANPTFFTLFIGSNDVLSYATSGGSGVDQTGNTDVLTYGSNDITDPNAFAAVYSQIVTALTANGAKGAVATIPDVTSIPFFTTVPIGTDAVSQAQADQLNSALAYGAYNAGLDQVAADTSNPFTKAFTQQMADARKISFTAGQINTFVVMDPSLTDLTVVNPALVSMRQIRPGELLTLTTPGDSIRCAQWGTAKPIAPQFHLTSDEIKSIGDAVASYNSTIKSIANANGLAFVDANARLKELATTGIVESGVAFSDAFISGGAFSLDGVHPATRGYAIIANDFIDAINSTYGANVPKLDVASYPAFEIVQ